jgi:hypothetical protein
MEPLTHLAYPVDKQRLLDEAKLARPKSKAYTDSRYPDMVLDDWLIGHHTSEYITEIMGDFGVIGRPRFYWMKPYAVIPEHTDNGTLCSINIILTEQAAPITIGGEQYFYDMILLDTTVPHSVVNNEHERIMLKISIFDEDYHSLVSRIKYRA